MNTVIFYFSSTGNSLYVAKRLKEEIGNTEIVSIKKALKEDKLNYSANRIGFVYPLHCFDIPPIVSDFLSRVKLNEDAYVFAVQVTGGDSSRNGFISINEKLASKNIQLKNTIEIKYISNYLRMGKQPSIEKAKILIEKSIEDIRRFARSIRYEERKQIPQNKTIVKNFLNTLWKEKFIIKDKDFNVNGKCIGCGLCQKICPNQNISMLNSKPKWHGKCLDCMSCINICPKEAINIGKKTIKKNRYRNPYIDKDELI